MTYAPGFIYGLGVVSGLVLAGIAFLIYLALRTPEVIPGDDETEATARVNAATARITANRGKVEAAEQVARNIEPGE